MATQRTAHRAPGTVWRRRGSAADCCRPRFTAGNSGTHEGGAMQDPPGRRTGRSSDWSRSDARLSLEPLAAGSRGRGGVGRRAVEVVGQRKAFNVAIFAPRTCWRHRRRQDQGVFQWCTRPFSPRRSSAEPSGLRVPRCEHMGAVASGGWSFPDRFLHSREEIRRRKWLS